MQSHQKELKDIVLITLFAALTAVGAFIKIPMPLIPFTLQIFFVFLSGALLGAKKGMYSQILYVVIGLIGFPILANGGGFSYIFQPSFGFLLGNILAAYLIGYILEKKKKRTKLSYLQAYLCGLTIIYLFGLVYFYLIYNFWMAQPTTWSYAIGTVILPFIIPDCIKAILSIWIAERLKPYISK